MPSSLTHEFFAHEGNQVDKWEQYLSIYDAEFARFINDGRPLQLLEIGVQNGGSLELWKKILPFGSSVRGVDIDPNVLNIRFADQEIRVDVADATTSAVVDLLSDEMFDVIIDDGSHKSDDIIKTFELCFNFVKPGGLYIIEDLHAAYLAALGGGRSEPGSAIRLLKDLVDALHLDHIEQDPINEGADIPFLRHYNRSIARITFYDSVAVIEKLLDPKVEPYRRILSGTTSRCLGIRRWLGGLPREQLAQLRMPSQTAFGVSHKLLEVMDAHLNDRAREKAALEARIRELEEDAQRQREAHAQRDADRARAHEEQLVKQAGRIDELLITSEDLRATIKALEADLQASEERTAVERNRAFARSEEFSVVQRQVAEANLKTAQMKAALDVERAAAQQAVAELRGKLNRAYAAWAQRGAAIERLKAI